MYISKDIVVKIVHMIVIILRDTGKTGIAKGPLTIWPVYAYNLAAQNTVTKLPMLIRYADDNSSMSYEEICVQIFA